jgi:hypothetical protein
MTNERLTERLWDAMVPPRTRKYLPQQARAAAGQAAAALLAEKDREVRTVLVNVARRFWRAGLTNQSDGVTEAIEELDRYLASGVVT